MENKLLNYEIILASGSGNRFQSDIPKQFIKIGNKTILEHTTECFENAEKVDRIILVVNKEYLQQVEDLAHKNEYKKVYKVIAGGVTRKDSSLNGVETIEDDEANILIHDGARPYVTTDIINMCISSLNNGVKALTTAIPMTDTVIEVSDKKVKKMPSRESLMRVQTPQGFKLSIIRKAHKLSKDDYDFTDDCGLVLKHKLTDIAIIKGSNDNIKITYPNDINIDN
jgi:2-C-methyl-D-erythritol 4-phosphate cytidylyltransferase